MPTSEDHLLHYQPMFTENKAVILLIDPNDGAIVDASQGACQYYGYSLSELTAMSIFNINTMTKTEIVAEMQRAKEGVKNHFNFRHQLASGEVRDVEVLSNPIPVEGQKFLYSVIHDVTERVQAEQALQESEQRFRAIFNNVLDGILVADVVDKQFIDGNSTICRMLGYEHAELLQLGIMDLHREEDLPYVLDQFEKQRRGEIMLAKDIPMLKKDGSTFFADISSAPFSLAGHTCLASVVRNITERKQVEKQLRHMAHFDSLTALPNRLLFFDRLEHELTHAKRYSKRLALMFLDLDRFKQINDELGHDMGDIVLKETAQRLKESIRESDTIARIGGDEFAVILPDIRGPEDAIGVAEKLLQGMSEPFRLDGQEHIVGGSIGISLYPNDGIDSKVLLKNADLAMYQVKKQGRNDYGLYANPLQREIDF